jgi:hypothetical protein
MQLLGCFLRTGASHISRPVFDREMWDPAQAKN